MLKLFLIDILNDIITDILIDIIIVRNKYIDWSDCFGKTCNTWWRKDKN